MKIKNINSLSSVLISLIIFLFSASIVKAFDFTLTRIGTLSTVGIDYSVVDYIGGIPTLEGTATPSTQVAVNINSFTGYATAASSSGVWQFVPSSLNTGANAITLSSGTRVITFELNFNSVTTPTPTATATATPTVTISKKIRSLPETGIWENMVFAILVGIGVIFLGFYVKEQMLRWEGKKK